MSSTTDSPTSLSSTLSSTLTTALSTVLESAAATSTETTTSTSASHEAPASYKIIGVSLAVGSGVLIGASFVIKKKGLLAATAKAGTAAGEGHAYLRNWIWWTGMIMMVLGEVLNFGAFAFTEAILVTPLGALSVVICAILSKFFLDETLTFFGWIGCALCILGAVILALNAPETQSVTTVPAFQKLWLAPGFLVWAGVCIAVSIFLAFWAAPRYGKTNMFVYITICSLIGGLSVSTLQGVGAAIMTSIRGNNQMKHWFLYVVSVFTVVTLLTEINYLNKALELFNTSMVTPTYYIIFTTCTLISSFILYQGLKASAVSLVTMVMGFLVTCLGITLLQMSKVDPKNFEKLDRRSTMLLAASRSTAEDPEKQASPTDLEEPGMDSIRGGFGTVGSIIRARSMRKLSNASSLPGRPIRSTSQTSYASAWQRELNTNTEGMQRYSLSDNPVNFAEDNYDQISLHSAVAQGNPRGRSGTLKFDDNDVVHQYDRKGHADAIHSSRLHVHPGEEAGGLSPNQSRPSGPARGLSGSSILSVPEEGKGGDVSKLRTPFDSKPSASDMFERGGAAGSVPMPMLAYGGPSSKDEADRIPHSSSRRGSFSALMNRLSSSDGPDLQLRPGSSREKPKEPDDMKRGGAHRGTKDYPHLRKSEVDIERQERQGLVGSGSDEEEVNAPSEPSDNEGQSEGKTKRQARRSSRRTSSITGRLSPAHLAQGNVYQNSYPPGR